MGDLLSPIIVLGMHRSGTSLLTGCLEAAGLHLGDVNHAAPFNKRGNKENEKIRDVHASILARHGLDWKHPPESALHWTADERARMLELLSPYREAGRPWGFKDPRAVWLLEGWLDLFPDASLIGVFRHPLLVAQSLAARPGDLHVPTDLGLHLWERTNRRLLALHHARAFPVLHFSHHAGDLPSRFFRPLAAFAGKHGLTGDPAAFLDRDLIHQTLPEGDAPRHVQHLYDQLLSASGASPRGVSGAAPSPSGR